MNGYETIKMTTLTNKNILKQRLAVLFLVSSPSLVPE